jgi:hypothetical protein
VINENAPEPKSKTAEELAEEASKRKMNIFFETWMQYLITHHVVQIIRSSYETTQVQGLIDQRPSIVENESGCRNDTEPTSFQLRSHQTVQ